jgi:4-amino-4-deoxy-L-arabinose transferase-like glycosyltransferase
MTELRHSKIHLESKSRRSVTPTDNPAPNGDSLSTPARLFWSALILATLYLCYFHNLGAIGLVGPDEPRYAWIARDMAETGDWVTPRLYGKPWFEKPVLYYWGAALSFKLFGVSEVAARLPCAFAALLATLALAWLAWRIYGAWTARWLLLLLPTTVGMIGFSHAAATDMPFAAALTFAMVFAAVILGLTRNSQSPSTPHTPWLALILFGFFLGLATLAKGPASIILSGGGVLLWATITKRWRDAFRCLHPAAIASFCVTALPWYILCSHRNPDFFRVFIVEHNFKRYLTPEFQHIQPFWYYVPILLVAFIPWTLALIWSTLFGAFRAWPKRRPSDATLLALCWAIFCLVFFSISKSKLPGYILPAVPAIGLLLAKSCAVLTPEGEKTFRWVRAGFSFLGFPAAIVLLWFGRSYAASAIQTEKMFSAGFTLFLFGFAALLLANRGSLNRSLRRSTPLCVVPVLVLVSAFGVIARPWLTPDPSGKSLALLLEKFSSSGLPDSECYASSMKRGQQFGISFYLHREIQVWDPENPKKGFLLLPVRDCDSRLVKAPWACSRDAIELGSTGWFAYRVFPVHPRPVSE